MSTALTKALAGENVSPSAAKGALKGAVKKIESLQTSANNARNAAREAGALVLNDIESAGALTLAAGAEGYYGGPDKFKVAGVDARGVLGLGMMAFGGYRKLRRKADGSHVHAIGQGLAHAVIAGWAVRRGQSMREKRDAQAAPGTTTSSSTTTAPQLEQAPLQGDDAINAFVRELRLPAGSAPALQRAQAMR